MSLKIKQCLPEKKKMVFSFGFSLFSLPGAQIRWLEVQQPSCDHEATSGE